MTKSIHTLSDQEFKVLYAFTVCNGVTARSLSVNLNCNYSLVTKVLSSFEHFFTVKGSTFTMLPSAVEEIKTALRSYDFTRESFFAEIANNGLGHLDSI